MIREIIELVCTEMELLHIQQVAYENVNSKGDSILMKTPVSKFFRNNSAHLNMFSPFLDVTINSAKFKLFTI